jgi:uncharacterized repeat protein (TIGR03803 family)
MRDGCRAARFAKAGFLFVALAVITALIAASPAAEAQTYTPLNAFRPTMGTDPDLTLLQDGAGDLYGTTYRGGEYGSGTVFERLADGELTALYNFDGQADGGHPDSNLILDVDGNLYGTTGSGGDMSCPQNYLYSGCGVVFRVTPAGQETVLHAFSGSPDGARPMGGLVFNPTTGLAYGVTTTGGAAQAGSYNQNGTVYSIDLTTGEEEVLYSFSVIGVSNPTGPLVVDTTGNMYGTASYFVGEKTADIIFKLTPTGQETQLASFYGADGYTPTGTLALDAEGNIYGATVSGGLGNEGTVFEVTPTGQFTVLHNFTRARTDGQAPLGGVTLGTNSCLYGTTYLGGQFDLGTVYQISLPTGTYSTLYSFRGYTGPTPDGQYPTAPPILGSSGILYGTTGGGGDSACTSGNTVIGCGTIFQIVP